MTSKKANLDNLEETEKFRVGAFSAIYLKKAIERGIPKYEFPEEGMSPRDAYQLIHDETSLMVILSSIWLVLSLHGWNLKQISLSWKTSTKIL